MRIGIGNGSLRHANTRFFYEANSYEPIFFILVGEIFLAPEFNNVKMNETFLWRNTKMQLKKLYPHTG